MPQMPPMEQMEQISHQQNKIQSQNQNQNQNQEQEQEQDCSISRIQLLPNFLINQIKAGEVIERPANLIKELIENSLDAKSRSIKIHIANNGLDFIEIVDDGVGILYEDLPLAFSRHTTSKISSFNDLYDLNSFGFRGEALASIAAVSRVTMISRPKGSSVGGKIIVEGGEILEYQQISGEDNGEYNINGTLIYVSDLFFNTPARLKFVKSKIAEKNSIKKILNAFILSSPFVNFEIRWDSKDRCRYEAIEKNETIETIEKIEKIEARVKQLWKGPALDQNELYITEVEYDGYRLKVILSLNANIGEQYLFVNKRLVIDKNIHQRIVYFFEQLNREREIEIRHENGNESKAQRGGGYCIFLDLPKDHLDVNVHPNKTFIKFLYSSLVYSLISESLKKIKISTPTPKNDKLGEESDLIVRHQNDVEDNRNDNRRGNNDSDNSIIIDSSRRSEQVSKKQYTSVYYISADSFLLMNYSYSYSNNYSEQLDLGRGYRENDELNINSLYVVNLQKLILYYFIVNLEKVNSFEESEVTPLLVSIPFANSKKNFDDNFKLYSILGFDFDRLSDSTIVLRSIPKFLNHIDYTKILEILIHSLERFFQNKQLLKEQIELTALKRQLKEYFLRENKEMEQMISNNKDGFRYMDKMGITYQKFIQSMIDTIGLDNAIKANIATTL
ncbi:MAG: ATP-binding protein [Oligoflexia bacterium]|nr:ATP-binding protein [Oligoflexia bacterium]